MSASSILCVKFMYALVRSNEDEFMSEDEIDIFLFSSLFLFKNFPLSSSITYDAPRYNSQYVNIGQYSFLLPLS